MKIMWLKTAAAFFALQALIGTAHATTSCLDLFSSKPFAVETGHVDVATKRADVFSHGKEEGLPLFSVKIHDQAVPVVLLNRRTIQSWSGLLEQSMGIAQELTPGNDADHGYIRLPGSAIFDREFVAPGKLLEGQVPTGVLMDLFSPGMAGKNAMNGNGYRFKSVAGYFQRRDQHSKVYVDLAYSLSREDMARVWLYHAAKRIALVRLQYAFDEANNYWINQQRRVLQKDGYPYWDKMTGGFEQCNNCRLGANATTHVAEMRGRLSHLFNKDVNQLYQLPETKKFLDEAKRDLLDRDWRDPTQYNPDFLNNPRYLEAMKGHFQEGLSHDAKVDAIGYLLATNIFEEVINLRDRLGIVEGRHSQFGNPNITSILIYSEAPAAVHAFYSADYEYLGAASGNGFSTRYFQSSPVYQPWHWPQTWSSYVP